MISLAITSGPAAKECGDSQVMRSVTPVGYACPVRECAALNTSHLRNRLTRLTACLNPRRRALSFCLAIDSFEDRTRPALAIATVTPPHSEARP